LGSYHLGRKTLWRASEKHFGLIIDKQPRVAEIRQFGQVVYSDNDVFSFDIVVQNAAAMEIFEARGDCLKI
jgi:hypothetical protein